MTPQALNHRSSLANRGVSSLVFLDHTFEDIFYNAAGCSPLLVDAFQNKHMMTKFRVISVMDHKISKMWQ